MNSTNTWIWFNQQKQVVQRDSAGHPVALPAKFIWQKNQAICQPCTKKLTIHQNGQYNTHLFYSNWIKTIQEGPLTETLVGFTNPSKVYHGLSRNPLFLVSTAARCSAATSEALGYHEHHGLAEVALQPAKRQVPRHGRCWEISAGNMAIWLPSGNWT